MDHAAPLCANLTLLAGGLTFSSPSLLAAAAVVGALVVMLARRGLGRARRGAAWTAALARGAAVALALVAASGPEVRWTETEPGESVLALHASSPSAAGIAREVRWPRDAPSAGAAAALARASLTADRPAALSVLGSADATARGAESALRPSDRVATAVVRPEAPSRDGPAARDAARDVSIIVPRRVDSGVPFRIVLDGGAAALPAGRASVQAGLREIELDIPGGARRYATPHVTAEGGSLVVEARFNDGTTVARLVSVAPPPRVLVATVDGTEPPFARRLRQQGFDVTVASAASAGLADADAPHDVLVLGPGAAGDAAAAAARALGEGRGVLVSGGRGAAGLGRFRGTALEDLLPVTAAVPDASVRPDGAPRPDDEPPPPAEPPPPNPGDGEPKKPVAEETERAAHRIALVLCVDRSGSMARENKLLMACESAFAAARTLSPEDRVGVIAFDVLPRWIVPMQSAADLAVIRRNLAALRADGGTAFKPALREAFQAALAETAAIRHVILLTDGEGEQVPYSDVIEPAAASGVTLSAIAVGLEADHETLGRMAEWGRGRLYPAVDPARLPQVVTADATRFALAPRDERRRRDIADPPPLPSAGSAERDAPRPPPSGPPPADDAPTRVPRLAFESPALAGFSGAAWPAWVHPEDAPLRAGATAPLVWAEGGPALAVGRALRGRIAAATADIVSADAQDLFAWHEQPRFAAQLVRSLAPLRDAEDPLRASALADASGGIEIAFDGAGTRRLVADRSPIGAMRLGDLAVARAPGTTRAFALESDADDQGGGRSESFLPNPSRADPVPADVAADATAALAGAASVVAPLPPPPGVPEERRRPAAPWLLALGACVLLVEAAARRGSSA